MWTNKNVVEGVRKYFTYHYEHLDDLSFLRDPKDVFAEHGCVDSVSAWIDAIADLLRENGWEGDGDIRILWFPPFADVGIENTWGMYVWVVKQSNNGESWIASPIELPFARLRAQNESRAVWGGRVAQSVTHGDTKAFRAQIETERRSLTADLASVGLGASSAARRVTEHSHARLVQVLFSYLDDCYLEVLQEVLVRGNPSGLKLRKASVKLDPTDYLPDDHDGDEDAGTWFTLRGIVSDMWHGFRFEPFDRKTELLFAPLSYKPDETLRFELRKHVQIRNCFQHHEGKLTKEALDRLGRDHLEIVTDGAPVELHSWSEIVLTGAELESFAGSLDRFAMGFESHIEGAVKSRYYILK